ncbi:MAG: hypothetical protein PF588_08265 [Candidatus Kapabacteria bacterium]|jgi:hypothetical protein|nr:hypothetical protein [Candidatus Kapabacteria bacterium]
MKKTLVILLLLFFSQNSGLAQGFDWQYSARLTFETPRIFIGATTDVSYLGHDADLNYAENDIACGRFSEGSGIGYSFGIKAEYWMSANSSYYAAVTYSYSPATFLMKDSNPLDKETLLLTEYEFNSDLSYINIQGGVNYRLGGSHFRVGLGARLGFIIANSSEHLERVISPKDRFTFPGGTHERFISEGKISDLYTVNFLPELTLSYDLNLGLGKYASPFIRIGIPVMDIAANDPWKRYEFSIGTAIMFGLR